jgi:hypothetical protein
MPGSFSFISLNGKKVIVKIYNTEIYINDVHITREQLAEVDNYTVKDIVMSEDQFSYMVCYISSQLNFVPA